MISIVAVRMGVRMNVNLSGSVPVAMRVNQVGSLEKHRVS
jgi:hypothetical protein